MAINFVVLCQKFVLLFVLCCQGPRRVVPLGDKLVDYAPAFRLMLLTRNPSPDLSPDARALVSEVLCFFILFLLQHLYK